MMRSMFSAISGLESNQNRMDVIGNNISNVNTIGYKQGRMTFQDALSQTMSGAVRPNGLSDSAGGVNPVQVGLGVSISSVDNIFSQGNLQSTGVTTDLALQGSAFFAVKKGGVTNYTRNGAFSIDANGSLVMPANGYVLQGLMADNTGTVPATAVMDDIKVPINSQAPAQATTKVEFARNLDADSAAKGTVSYSKPWYTAAQSDILLTGLHNSGGTSLGIQAGDSLTISGKDSDGNTVNRVYTVGETDTLDTLAGEISSFLSDSGAGGSASVEDGKLVVKPNGTINQFSISSNRSTSNSYVQSAFSLPTSFNSETSTGTLLMAARSSTKLADVVDQNGHALGLETGDKISLSAAVGGNVGGVATINYDAGSTTMGDIVSGLQSQLKLPDLDGTPQNNKSVTINQAGEDGNIPDGAIVLRGQAGKDFGLTNISIVANNSNSEAPAPTYFNGNTSFTETQTAKEAGVVSTSITTYDDKGFEHNIQMTFTPSDTPNEWLWQVKSAGQEEVLGGSKGHLIFGTDGTVASFTYDDSAGALKVDPQNGASLMDIKLDVGGPGNLSGLTQYRASSTATASKQDGYTMGVLQSISIGSDGTVVGSFTNGQTRNLAQVMVADFSNAQGLFKESESVYSKTPNSGDPIYGRPGKQSSTQLKAGTLEMSNVDLATEFTNMIITQRGYQANTRVISTSDQMLQELVNLSR